MTQNYEKLGAFYLGRAYNPETRSLQPDPVLYDARDLTTHAVIIGMTGSGKTGLGIGLIEEALIDSIPVIAIDPKGDLPNLLLQFPDLKAADFLPWVNPGDAAREGMTPEQYAACEAEAWRTGLGEWGQGPERIARLASAAELAVYTPGSTAGRPVSVLRNFAPPPPGLMEDADLLRERIQSTVTGLLGLLGLDADPMAGREHILIANIFETAWAEGRTLDLAGLIRAVQAPPFERVGVMPMEMFFPEKDRFALAIRLNNLLASPGFEAWMDGPPLEIDRFLYTDRGRPRASIFTISHLSDAQRMFFVTFLLNQVLGWLRTQPGTASLRAVLYMDEIFGYFPPVGNPPAKGPLLTLLKQARAYGLGIVLSTQNPVDLDYKGLANTGSWFIGRLQTERDKARVLSGLEGAAAGAGFDRGRMEEVLAGLGKRVFLLHNIHDTRPVIFQTRWTLSYLSGPMTRDQIRRLNQGAPKTAPEASDMSVLRPHVPPPTAATPPVSPPGIDVFFLAASGAGTGLYYAPALIGRMDVHYSHARHGVEVTRSMTLAAGFQEGPVPFDWDSAASVDAAFLTAEPVGRAEYAELPAPAQKAAAYAKWRKELVQWVCRNRPVTLYQAADFKLTSRPGESEGAFRARLAQAAREARDLAVERLRRKYADRFAALRDRLMLAEQAVAREEDQVRAQGAQTAISFGGAILGALLGRKVVSEGAASRMGTAMKSASRIGKERMDVARARERADAVREKLAELDRQLQDDIDAIEMRTAPEAAALEAIGVRPKSTDVAMDLFGLVWMPFHRSADGRLSPDWN
ncbi:ATP-binding protein [Desulfococcus sp.]|uniref:ATP-binding protein n=1 Tax=Desulfococcus sp. TaxID=2025834 RepID=UPI0035930C0F